MGRNIFMGMFCGDGSSTFDTRRTLPHRKTHFLNLCHRHGRCASARFSLNMGKQTVWQTLEANAQQNSAVFLLSCSFLCGSTILCLRASVAKYYSLYSNPHQHFYRWLGQQVTLPNVKPQKDLKLITFFFA